MMTDSERILHPYCELCDCGTPPPHAYIYDALGKKVSPMLFTKKAARHAVIDLAHASKITIDDAARLRAMIGALDLLQSEKLN